ncbi:alpha/beta hydrolase [Rubrobacter indicoceani]|uniref:alpha/beta hydrolase n=1 Tax=Rubrobacter indicoceani TaxID=2051957 RepID=UPI0013C48D74|nr:alpha/beta hydrolase [Rubrobacter indicoceani]
MMNLSVAVREYGYWLGIINLLLGALCLLSGRPARRVLGLLNLLSGALLFVPVLRALGMSDRLHQQLVKSFGDSSGVSDRAPFSIIRLFGSAAERLRGVEISTHVYSRAAGQELKLDFYSDGDLALRQPCVVVLAGGSWQRSDRKRFAALNPYLASLGYRIAVVEYRTAPEFRFPSALDDVRSALSYLKENADILGLAPNRFVLLGRSAGAQLALLEAYTGTDDHISGVVSFYGAIDLPYAYANPPNPKIVDVRRLLEDYLGGSLTTDEEVYREASPINFVGSDSPPTLLLHGSRDEMVSHEQSERLSRQLTESSVAHLLISLPWATHGFDHNLYGPGGQISTYAVEAFLSAVTRSEVR